MHTLESRDETDIAVLKRTEAYEIITPITRIKWSNLYDKMCKQLVNIIFFGTYLRDDGF